MIVQMWEDWHLASSRVLALQPCPSPRGSLSQRDQIHHCRKGQLKAREGVR